MPLDNEVRAALEQSIADAFEAKLFVGNRVLMRRVHAIAQELLQSILDPKTEPVVAEMFRVKLILLLDLYDSIVAEADRGDDAVKQLAKDREEGDE